MTRRRIARPCAAGQTPADLLIVDGGIAQARAAQAELRAAGVDRPVFGLAKREELLVPPEGEPIRLPVGSPALRVLVRLRNEAHRFANTFRRKTSGRRVMRSALLALPGVGLRTLQKIVAAFGSVERAGQASPADLAQRAGLSPRLAALVVASLQPSAPKEGR